MPPVTVGRTVLYTLSAADLVAIRDQRAYNEHHQRRSFNSVNEGDVLPAIVVKVWSPTCANIQVLLDGGDTLWKTSVVLAGIPADPTIPAPPAGCWFWPPRADYKVTGDHDAANKAAAGFTGHGEKRAGGIFRDRPEDRGAADPA